MKIWNAILEGCRDTQQIRGNLYLEYEGVKWACAMGAAYISEFGCIPDEVQENPWPELDRTFKCEHCNYGTGYGFGFIVHLNDVHGMSRESIAFYLRDLIEGKPIEKNTKQEVTA